MSQVGDSTIPTSSSWRKKVMDYLLPLAFIALYFFLQLWLLPRFGIRT
ncbi:MAG TPA: hypothetical protein PKD72_02640 [Gemmatales bacterium]|nr:hypothetical protein [Gemmatales bacterium]